MLSVSAIVEIRVQVYCQVSWHVLCIVHQPVSTLKFSFSAVRAIELEEERKGCVENVAKCFCIQRSHCSKETERAVWSCQVWWQHIHPLSCQRFPSDTNCAPCVNLASLAAVKHSRFRDVMKHVHCSHFRIQSSLFNIILSSGHEQWPIKYYYMLNLKDQVAQPSLSPSLSLPLTLSVSSLPTRCKKTYCL